MIKIEKYYMCHYQKLNERKKYVESVVSKYKIELQWVLDFDKEVLNRNELSKEYPLLYSYDNVEKLSLAEISLSMKHFAALRDAVFNNYQNVVIFEDDIILCDDFDSKLDSYLDQLPEDYDILWIGTCCDLHAPQTDTKSNVYLNLHGSRCTHAYVISQKGCKKILENSHKISKPIDWFFNELIGSLKMDNYWAEPPLSTQNLTFESSIDCGRVQ